MNAKILKGKSAGGLIDYLNDMKAKDARVIFANGISASTNQSVVTAFNLQWANGSSKIKDKMGHLVISFLPKDRERMSDEFASRLCQEYMRRMKFPPTIYIGYRHLDHDHDHIHIAYSRIDNNGKAITCDFNFARSVQVCNAIREKYGLSNPSTRKREVNRDRLKGKDKVKYQILDAAFPVLDRATSWREFIKELAKQGIAVTIIKGDDCKARGIVYTADNLSFAGAKVDKELSFCNLQRVLGGYELEVNCADSRAKRDGLSTTNVDFSDMTTATESSIVPSCNYSEAESSNEKSSNFTSLESTSEQSDGILEAAVELVMQPHQAPSSGGGGGGSNDDEKKEKREKENYIPYKRRR